MGKKRAFFYTLLYLLFIVFLRFLVSGRILKLPVKEFLILSGGVLGAIVLDFEERLMIVLNQPSDKPVLRNVLSQIVLIFLAFYIGTSTVSLFPLSFVLGFLVRSLVEQYLELQGITLVGLRGLSSWFWFLGQRPELQLQKIYLAILGFFVFYFSLTLV